MTTRSRVVANLRLKYWHLLRRVWRRKYESALANRWSKSAGFPVVATSDSGWDYGEGFEEKSHAH